MIRDNMTPSAIVHPFCNYLYKDYTLVRVFSITLLSIPNCYTTY